jgi:putative flavoprotein involved in K+ transport
MGERIVDVLVVGAGQAGLAAGYHLSAHGIDHRIVERARRVGDNWRERYDSLTLFTPRAYSVLPGRRLDGNPDGYPGRDEFADYLEAYAAFFDLRIDLGTEIRRLSKAEDGRFRAEADPGGAYVSRNVILAHGPFRIPVIPDVAKGLAPSVRQFTTTDYRNPGQLPQGTILIVGDGASGRDFAAEAARTREVLLATGRRRRLLPERILGRSLWWWLSKLGLLSVPADSFLGRRMREADPFPDRNRSLDRLAAAGVRIVPRLIRAEGTTVTFKDGRSADVDGVVWAMGYRNDSGWIDVPGAVASDGSFHHTEGVSPIQGLYFVGLPWQHNRASALILGAGADAEVIVERILDTSAREVNPT